MSVRQYIGARYVPLFADPIEWDSTRSYEPLTVVMNQGTSYVSKQSVPVGIEITNETYWLRWADYNAQLEEYIRQVQLYSERITTLENKFPINTIDIANSAITNAKLDNNSVDTSNVVDGAITNDKLDINSVNTSNVVDDAITNDKLANDSVDTSNIVDGAITNDKLANDVVTKSKIANNSINYDKIENDIIFGFQNFQGTVACPYGYIIIPKNKVQIGIVNNSGLQTYEMTSNVFEYMRKHNNFDIAHNCNFVGPRTINEMPLRLNGVDYNTTYPFDYGAFAFNSNTQEMAKYASGSYLANIPTSYDNVFMCSYQLVSNGVAIHNYQETDYYAPRLAFGWNDDNYFIIWAEGRQLGYPGLLLENMADIGVTLGAQELINFDGGGSVNVCVRDQFGNVAKINEFRDKTLPYPQLRNTSLCFGYKFI